MTLNEFSPDSERITEDLIPRSLPRNHTLREGKHLFEQVHGKDPYAMIEFLQEYYPCTGKYELVTVR